ncbi:MAG: DNA helicase RecQ [Smithella sp.]|jgi:ATP-dependent DNA helicase RecQ
MNKKQILKKYFGYDSFFPLQAEIIDHVLSLNDALVLMPTGGGKSVCFQIPALMFDGVTIVISPLISLMKDQVEALKANGIVAEFLNSSLSAKEEKIIIERSLKGTLKLLYVSPERLSSAGFIELLGGLKVSMFAVDEAHCISFWGHDFRPEYKRLNILKKRYPNVPLIALTATADRVIRRDILSQLNIPETRTFVASFDRPNLSLAVRPGLKRMRQITDFLKLHWKQPGIIYCHSRKSTESVANNLSKLGYKAKHYHAGMDNDLRSRTQNEFIRDEIQIICATVAFGMGIDKSNVRWVIHYNMPKNIESFYQEIGRCGRDGLPADTILFYSYADVMAQTEMLNEATPERRELLDAKLKRMKQYAEAESCRRRILLSYFNETNTEDCGNCDVCKNPPQKFDGTVIAQKALSAIARTGEQINSTLLIDILRGSHNRQVMEKGYDKIKTWGAGRDLRWEEWSDYIFQILNLGYVDIAYDEGYTFKLNDLSHLVLKNKINVMLVKYRPYKSREELVLPKEPAKTVLADLALFDRLKKLRKTIADRNNIPAYIVFSDKTLQDMTEKMPTDKPSMMDVSGVGQQKFASYGQLFIDEISGFVSDDAAKGNKIKG